MLRGASAEAPRRAGRPSVGRGHARGDRDAGRGAASASPACCGPSRRCAGSLTDASVEGEAKAGLAGAVFGGKVGDADARPGHGRGPAALDRSRDLADVLEQLGIEALVRSAGAQGAARRATSCSPSGSSSTPTPTCATRCPTRPGRPRTTRPRCSPGCSTARSCRPPCALVGQAVGAAGGSRRTRRSTSTSDVAADAHDELLADRAHRPAARPRRAASRLTAGARQASTTPRSTCTSSWTPSLIGGLRVEIGDDVIDGTVAQPGSTTPAAARRLTPTDRLQTTAFRRHNRRRGRDTDDGAFDSSGGDPRRAPEVRRRLQAVGGQQGGGRHRRRGRRRHRPRRPACPRRWPTSCWSSRTARSASR